MNARRYDAIDPATRCVVRAATAAEVEAYEGQAGIPSLAGKPALNRSFFQAIRVGDVLVEEDTAPDGPDNAVDF